MEATASLAVFLAVFLIIYGRGTARRKRDLALQSLREEAAGPSPFPPKGAGRPTRRIAGLLEALGRKDPLPPTPGLRELLADVEPVRTLEHFQGMRCLCAAALTLLILSTGLPGLLLAPFTLALGYRLPLFLLRRKHAARQESLSADLPEAADLMAVLCYAGESLYRALQSAPLACTDPYSRRHLERAAHSLQVGESLTDALNRLCRHPNPDMRRLGRTLLRAEEGGSPVAEILEELAVELRSARREKDKVRAGRASIYILFPLVFMILPSFLLVTLGSILIGHIP